MSKADVKLQRRRKPRVWMAVLLGTALLAGRTAAKSGEGPSSGDLTIVDARIITGVGQVIERGSLVVRDGRIASVTAGPPPTVWGRRIDAQGMTAIAGYIDCHRHLVPAAPGGGSEANERFLQRDAPGAMEALLESGVTTVQSGGDDRAAVLQLRRMVEDGRIKGPRIIAGPWAIPPFGGPLTMTEAQVRAAVDATRAAGADSIGEIPYPTVASPKVDTQWPFQPTEQETRNLAAALDEGRKLGIEVQVHAVSPPAQVAAVKLGARRLVHSSHYAFMTDAQAQAIAASGAIVASSTGTASPVFGVFSQDGRPTTRDGRPWPKGSPSAEDRGQAAGKFPVNLRTLYDNGVTVAYSSDTDFDPTAGLSHELGTLSLVFSPQDLVKIIGPNSAAFVDHEADRGVLQPGKIADILLLTGDPLQGYWNFLKPVLVIKGGTIVVDKRSQLRTVRTL